MKRSEVDYWGVMFYRHEWCKDHQLECEVRFESYYRIHKIICSLDLFWTSRDWDYIKDY